MHKVASVKQPLKNSQAEERSQLTFGANAMILVEIGEPSLRKGSFDPIKNPPSLWADLALVEEAKKQA
ncbi:hypothetical protein CR513_17058, partial [Mucuna pruriens]